MSFVPAERLAAGTSAASTVFLRRKGALNALSQAAEKVTKGKESIPQRLKPNSICGTYGTTQVVR